MAISNVTVRSNVFVRTDSELRRDRSFIMQVRGASALMHLLRVLEPSAEPISAARRHLSEDQLTQVAWQARCAHCGALPEGPVALPGGLVEVQFRCPRSVCHPPSHIARTIVIDVNIIRECTERFGTPLSEIVQDALDARRADISNVSAGPAIVRVPITIRLTLTQHYRFGDAHIEHALRLFLSACPS